MPLPHQTAMTTKMSGNIPDEEQEEYKSKGGGDRCEMLSSRTYNNCVCLNKIHMRSSQSKFQLR